MRYIVDNDLHIHTHLSTCSQDENQTPENIIKVQKANGFKTLCLTDHYWDDEVPCNTAVNRWYHEQNFEHIAKSLPLPLDDEVTLLFGCEADLDSDNNIGVPKSRYDDFDFIIVSTTHFHHMAGKNWENCTNKDLAKHWVNRFDAVLNADLPFGKVGIAHLACELINRKSREDLLEVLDFITDSELKRLFTKAAKLGLGIELNVGDMRLMIAEPDRVLRIFKTAKDCGCKFYFGSDSHESHEFAGVKSVFEQAVDLLHLTEEDKFKINYK